jgi:ATP-binding cassette, subfamily C (CFTR/MRP), member 1
MHEITRTEFTDKTVICVAHKLADVLYFHKAIVLEDGRVREIGAPKVLIKQPLSAFRDLRDRYK